jgi:hypothetical protein
MIELLLSDECFAHFDARQCVGMYAFNALLSTHFQRFLSDPTWLVLRKALEKS